MSENHLDLSDSNAIPDTSVSEDEREPDSSETAHSVIEPHPRERVPSLDILSLMSCFLAIGALILLHSLYVRDPKDFACLPVELILKENPDLITIQIVSSHDSGSSAVSLVDEINSEISQIPSTVNFSGTLNSISTGMFNVLMSLAPKVRVKKIWQKSLNASLAAFRRIGKRSKGETVVRSGAVNQSANISDRKTPVPADGYISLFHVGVAAAGRMATALATLVGDAAPARPRYIYSKEKGFLMLSDASLRRHGVRRLEVRLAATDACLVRGMAPGGRLGAAMVRHGVGFDAVVANELQATLRGGYLHKVHSNHVQSLHGPREGRGWAECLGRKAGVLVT
eukprot:CAMPEP_0172169506 /NCGR_PEP_ID=MMETSP1050-20130122/10738_1 /TAXON_ID=233186 /ORGANISM="Cryptomonas curvata, Strain CCAP979/52" /LENGTH=339 /DNA_ID=CAMNT_0012840561 /DNA_START=98 /DNA_END=1114 /DNA_ORIENTATION=+